MRHYLVITFFYFLLQGQPLLAQKQAPVGKGSQKNAASQEKNSNIQHPLNEKAKKSAGSIKTERKQLKDAVKEDVNSVRIDSTRAAEMKKNNKATAEQKLENKATHLEYDSEDPENAPWKKKQLSKDDAQGFDLPSKNDLKSGEKVGEYKNKMNHLPDEKDLVSKKKQAGGSQKLDQASHLADSVMEVKQRIEASGLDQELGSAKKVYSRKYIQRVYDSLGIKKGDSLLQLASALAKTETPKEELLNRINNPVKEKSDKAGIGFDEKTQSLKSEDAQQLNGLNDQIQNRDISALQLPADALSELPPLSGGLLDSKYLNTIDSMRDVTMKAKGYVLQESKLTDDLKKASFVKKPTFMDKSYFEMILGFVSDSSFTVVQVSPSWAYHFTNHVSVGVGPNVAVEVRDKKINGLIGFRSYLKTEFYKQRAYVQLEDNAGQTRISKDAIRTNVHSILLGAGGILPLSKKIGLNLAVFYRLNQQQVRPGGTPWVFRIGLSSIKKNAPR